MPYVHRSAQYRGYAKPPRTSPPRGRKASTCVLLLTKESDTEAVPMTRTLAGEIPVRVLVLAADELRTQ